MANISKAKHSTALTAVAGGQLFHIAHRRGGDRQAALSLEGKTQRRATTMERNGRNENECVLGCRHTSTILSYCYIILTSRSAPRLVLLSPGSSFTSPKTPNPPLATLNPLFRTARSINYFKKTRPLGKTLNPHLSGSCHWPVDF